MGIALMMEGVLSACYHVCPNYSNFQFGKTSCLLLCLKKDLPSLSPAELKVFLTFLLLQSFKAWSEDSASLDEKRKLHSKTGECLFLKKQNKTKLEGWAEIGMGCSEFVVSCGDILKA